MNNTPLAINDLKLPVMPESLRIIRAEQAKAEPDLEQIIGTISSDVGMAAEVLKTVNSPLFSRGQSISSIPTAIMLLGMTNVIDVCAATTLRDTMHCPGGIPSLERFWDTANDVALASAMIAHELSGLPADMAYTLGLFHDCGIPVLMCHRVDYLTVLKQGELDELVVLEKARYGLTHAQIGAHISKAWQLPQPISAAILMHHHFSRAVAHHEEVGEDVISLIGILKMAEHISHEFRGVAFRNGQGDLEWERDSAMVLSHFELDEVDFGDLKARILTELGSS